MRGSDAIQLASAVHIQRKLVLIGTNPDEIVFTFISADNDLNAAASGEGLPVENPNDYP
ncbi:MAG: hypothetical protein WKF34_14110 [Pyrinomonadaceae bacterium]